MTSSERQADFLQAADIHHAAADESRCELRQDAAQYGSVVVPVGCLPGTPQQVGVKLHVRHLQDGEFFSAAPVTFTVELVGTSGHPTEGGGETVHSGLERCRLVEIRHGRSLSGTPGACASRRSPPYPFTGHSRVHTHHEPVDCFLIESRKDLLI